MGIFQNLCPLKKIMKLPEEPLLRLRLRILDIISIKNQKAGLPMDMHPLFSAEVHLKSVECDEMVPHRLAFVEKGRCLGHVFVENCGCVCTRESVSVSVSVSKLGKWEWE